MATDIIEEATKDIGKFMEEFGAAYVQQLLTSKIQDAIQNVVDDVKPKGPEEEKNEEKSLQDKMDDVKPIASGAALLSYKTGWGPDHIEHRYYDFAAFSIKPQNSVITNVTYRHRQLTEFQGALKKRVPKAGGMAFPQKKLLGKKDYDFYFNRFSDMQKYFDEVSKENSVTMDNGWLTFFKLQFDPVADLRLQIFTGALQSVATDSEIDWQWSFSCAQRLGLDSSEVDLLKIVAVEKIGRDAAWRVYDKVWEVTPSFIPYSVKAKVAYNAENKMYAAVGTTVETAWKGVEEGFNKVADQLSDAMDKAIAPIEEMVKKVLEPVKELIAKKMGNKEKTEDGDKESSEKKEEDIDELLKKVKADRFPPLKDAMAALAKGEGVAETCRNTMNRICDLDWTWRYAPYIQYPHGDPIWEWFPPIENIVEKHQRLTVAVVDVVYVLGRAMCRALEPLCQYVDKAAENFDEKTHEEELRKAVWEGGRKLAIDYFSLPYTTWCACWWCGSDVSSDVLTFCRETVNMEADLLGSAAANWKPTRKDDVKETFAQALKAAVDDFISDRTYILVMLIRDASIQLVADLFTEMFEEDVKKIGDMLTDLVSALPSPLSTIQPANMIDTMFTIMVSKASTAAVKRWAGKTERFIADPSLGEPTPWQEELAKKFRSAPRIRKDDDKNDKPEVSEEEKKRNVRPNKGGDTATDDAGTTDATTTE